MPENRDPRKDPRPGDVLRETDFFSNFYVVTKVDGDTISFLWIGSEHNGSDTQSLPAWRDQHGTPEPSEVLHVAGA
jgi:hypothetical protein